MQRRLAGACRWLDSSTAQTVNRPYLFALRSATP